MVALHDGYAKGRRTAARTAIRLIGYETLRGVAFDGTIDTTAGGGYRVAVRVRGRDAGQLRIAAGRLTGRLDGVRLDVRLPADLGRPAVRRFG